MQKKIGLFFGSFNPIHIGHLIIGEYVIENTDIDKLWFIITPHNPFKERTNLLEENHRYYMANMAIENDNRFKASNIEFKLTKPSYTVNTLIHLSEKYPQYTFNLIMGEDNYNSIDKWKNYQFILNNYAIYVYPRKSEDKEVNIKGNIKHVRAPLIEISSSYIRNCIKGGKDFKYIVPESVYNYIKEMNFYK